MKKNIFCILSMTVFFTGFASIECAQPLLPLMQEKTTTKSGKPLTIIPATKEQQIKEALKLLKRRFPRASHTFEHQEIGAYLTTPDGKKLVGALNFLPCTPMRPSIHICNIFVDTRIQNSGIGTALLEYLIRHAQCEITLCTIDTKATRLYKKFGFYSYDPECPGSMKRDYTPHKEKKGAA